jgi:hypothetical protein
LGIQAKPELNGAQGIAVQFVADRGRFQIRLDGANATTQALRLECLRLVPRHGALTAAPAAPAHPRGGVMFFGDARVEAVKHIPLDTFDELVPYAVLKKPAMRDFKYWGGAKNKDTGAEEPWRNGTTDAAVTDRSIIEAEEVHRSAAKAEDASRSLGKEAHGILLHSFALRVDFIVALTFALNLWKWKTWEVVQFLVKPATEAHGGRCRFAELPCVKPFTGPATVFLSHAWNGNWGDAVAAACQGARMDRFVWIDIAAVRQWPGNEADLDFRAVVRRSRALVVAAAPVPGTISAEEIAYISEIHRYRASPEYKEASRTLAFCRLWCIGAFHQCVRLD